MWYSLRALDGEYKGRVIGHAQAVLLLDVDFVVSERGRQRVLQERRKNVHAGVTGVPVEFDTFVPRVPINVSNIIHKSVDPLNTPVTYNPYKYNKFVIRQTCVPIDGADLVALTSTGASINRLVC